MNALAEPPDPTEIELQRKRELLKKAHLIRERARRASSQITGRNPKKVYVWVWNNTVTITEYEGREYSICRDEKVVSPFKKEDGSHRRGDLVLMEVDAELYEAMKMYEELLGFEAIRGHKDQFLEFARKEGIPTFTPENQ